MSECVAFITCIVNLPRTILRSTSSQRTEADRILLTRYMILATSTIATFLKYALYVGDMVMEGQWDNKAVYIFYLELVRDLIHLSLYLFFFLVIFM